MVNSGACQELETKVIHSGICTLCGACVGHCPYFAAYEGKVLLKDACDLPEGRCRAHLSCPRISVDLDGLSQAFFGHPYAGSGLGSVRQVMMARTRIPAVQAKAQDAGTVTTLVRFALEEGWIDTAVLTLSEDKSWPRGIIAKDGKEVLSCAGSSYLAAPTIEAFNRAVGDGGCRSLGVVGTPCQLTALAKMRAAPPEIPLGTDRLKLTIGLFCTWALAHPAFTRLLEARVSSPVRRCEIPPHPANVLLAFTEKERVSIPIDEVLPFVRPACRVCMDLTAEFSDLSVGGGRGEVSGWNTLVIRTEKGLELVDSARRKGVIETAPIPEENLRRLENAADIKRRRGMANILRNSASPDDLLYLKPDPGIIRQLAAECWEGGR
jgi:coenzyme F420 hydrogenase subunit beta